MFAAAALSIGALSQSAPALLADKTVATFDGGAGTTFKWVTENDPVMGGVSESSWTPVSKDKAGEWKGQVKIVPFLRAPGFCTVRTDDAKLPSLSQYVTGGLDVTLRRGPQSNLTEFQMQLQSSVRSSAKKGGFQGNFKLPAVEGWQTVHVPFASFVESWRGEKEGGPPSAAQLGGLYQIGLGCDGTAGIFDIEIREISATVGKGPAPPQPQKKGVVVVDFAEGSKTRFAWTDLNDPVMGGLSTSSFREEHSLGVFNGTVRVVPSLKAPGFCNAEGRPNVLKGQRIPDVSSTITGGLVFSVASKGPMTSFKASFGNALEYDFGSWKADFDVPADGATHDIYIPYHRFSNKWSSATGEPIVKCEDDGKVCPTAAALGKLGSIGIWAEGKAGDFHLEVHQISAVTAAPE